MKLRDAIVIGLIVSVLGIAVLGAVSYPATDTHPHRIWQE